MLELFITVIQALLFFIAVILKYLPFRDVVNKKQKITLFVSYATIIAIDIIVMLYLCYSIHISKTTIQTIGFIVLILTTVVNIIIIKKHIKEHFFTLGIMIIFSYLLMILPTYIVQHTTSFDDLKGTLLFVIYYLVSFIVVFIPLKKILDKTVKPFLDINVGKYWNTIWFIPIGLLTALSFMIPHNEHTETIDHLVGHFMLALVLVLICLSIAKDYNNIKEQLDMKDNINKSKIYYAGFKNKMDEMRKNNHNLKHLLLSIRHYIDTDDKSGLSDFCNEIEQNNLNNEVLPYTGNSSIDGIIYHYLQLSKLENIDFKYMGSIISNGIGDMDLSVLLGNALDNAYTACLKSKNQRSISLIAQSEENVLSIVIQNTFDGKMDIEKDIILSRKRNKEKGIGLESMKEICEKYNGNIQIKWDEEKFTLLIMLPINQE